MNLQEQTYRMKSLISKMGGIFSEVRKDPSEVNTNEMGLFIYGNGYTLYNPIEDKVYATMEINKLNSGNYSVGGVAAEYGYGVLIYELVMTHIYPKALMPTRDGDVREGAINIWQRFLNTRPDVKKIKMTQDDEDYSWEVHDDFGDDGFEFVQTKYYYNGLEDILNKLIVRAKKYDEDNIISFEEVKTKGEDYWLEKYD